MGMDFRGARVEKKRIRYATAIVQARWQWRDRALAVEMERGVGFEDTLEVRLLGIFW